MEPQTIRASRVFKTAAFSKSATKAHITEEELCTAIHQVMLGQADDLGGGVFKKRLSKNLVRSLILARGGTYWVYEYLFAKKDRANIDEKELAAFRRLAKEYASLSEETVQLLTRTARWLEICHESKEN